MLATPTMSATKFTLTLTEEERAKLLNFLEQALRDKHVEAHRTEAFDYREYVQHEEALLEGLVNKLRRP